MKSGFFKKTLILMAFFLIFPFAFAAADSPSKQRVFDDAGLLSDNEVKELEKLAEKHGAKRDTDFIILTSNNEENKDVVEFMQDFYDEQAPGYDKPHGNTAILTLDMKNRDVYVAGFYKAETYLDNHRATLVREKITPDLSDGNYYKAFQSFIKTSSKYMGIRPGVDPDNILFNLWFQIIASLAIAGAIVGIMAFNTGGKVTVNARTYQDNENTRVNHRRDQYIRTTTTKRRKPSNKSSGSGFSGGGGGGVTRGGHSHSGSRGKF
nr:TPM domain-containing protein [Siminovitchia fortis]